MYLFVRSFVCLFVEIVFNDIDSNRVYDASSEGFSELGSDRCVI
jgi:hypothetical protein